MFLTAIDQHLSRYSDLGKLFTRLTVAAFMLPHGITKLPFLWGLAQPEATLTKAGLPASLAVLAYVGEILAPLMILLGWRARIGALLVIATMLVALCITVGTGLFGLDTFGGFKGEKAMMYITASLAILCLGSGKYSLEPVHEKP